MKVLEDKVDYYNERIQHFKERFEKDAAPNWQNAIWEMQAFRDEYAKLQELILQVSF